MTYTDTELTTMRMRAESMIEGGAFDTDELLELLGKLIPPSGAVSPIGKLTGMVIALAIEHVDPSVHWHVETLDRDPDCAWLCLTMTAPDNHRFGVRADFRIADATRPDFELWAERKVRAASRSIIYGHAAYVKDRF